MFYSQSNHSSKKKLGSDASLTAATAGDISSSERTFLLTRNTADDAQAHRHLNQPWWTSGSSSYDALHQHRNNNNEGCRKLCRSATIIVLMVVVLVAYFVGVTQTNKVTNPTDRPPADLEDSDVLQWWQETADISMTRHSLPAPSLWEPLHQKAADGGAKESSTAPTDDDNRDSLRWGILGAGRIARDFTTTLKMAGCQIQAVAAGSLPHAAERAHAFAQTYDIPQSYGSYAEMAADPSVDIVYVATTNQLHYTNVLQLLEAGKNVLVEKPMTVTLREAQEMADAAQRHQRFLMTNFWTRFFPVYANYTLPMIRGTNGDVLKDAGELAMQGDFAFVARPQDTSSDRLLQRDLGGGVLLDLGCYLVNVAVMAASALFQRQHGVGDLTSELHSVDIRATGTNEYNGKRYAVDTEVSFALQWQGKSASTINQDSKDRRSLRTRSNATPDAVTNDVSFFVSGSVSFRRPSSFDIDITGRGGRLQIPRQANAPHAATWYNHAEPYGPVTGVEHANSPVIAFDESYGPEKYPGATGFLYVISAIEDCMHSRGIPGRSDKKTGCLNLDTLPMKEQLLTVEITEELMKQVGYWDDQFSN